MSISKTKSFSNYSQLIHNHSHFFTIKSQHNTIIHKNLVYLLKIKTNLWHKKTALKKYNLKTIILEYSTSASFKTAFRMVRPMFEWHSEWLGQCLNYLLVHFCCRHHLAIFLQMHNQFLYILHFFMIFT